MNKKLCFIGAGNMAEAMIRGLLQSGSAAREDLLATDPRDEQREHFKSTFGIAVSSDNRAAASVSKVVVLAVKPQSISHVLSQIAPSIDSSKLVVSIAAGVPLAALERALAPDAHVVRAMPNTPALVGAAATALSPGRNATEEDVALAKTLFDAVGVTMVVEESLLDAVTGLSGSGPAYVFLILEALADAGVKMGLPRVVSQKLAAQTLLGSAKLQIETGLHPGVLKDQVTSPAGTTIAALHALEAGGLRSALMDAVEVATRRAKELGERFLAST